MVKAYADQLALLHHAMVRDQREAMIGVIMPARAEAFSPASRLAVYVDGYSERLMGAVEADFPTLRHCAGAEMFSSMVRDYVVTTPSKNWDLNLYPIAFGEFVRRNINDAGLRAIGALEAAIVEVFWLPDSDPLDPSWLSDLPQEKLGEQVFIPRKAHQLVSLEAQAEPYLAALRLGDEPEPIRLTPQQIYLVRHRNEIQRLVLDPIEFELLSSLIAGKPFGQALEEVAATPSIDMGALFANLPAYMSRWLVHGVFGVNSRDKVK